MSGACAIELAAHLLCSDHANHLCCPFKSFHNAICFADSKVPEPNKHYAMAALLPQPLAPAEGLVVQYEVQFTETHNCGGAYLKLLSHIPGWQPKKLGKKTTYSIMFGPDKCGAAARVRMCVAVHVPCMGCLS